MTNRARSCGIRRIACRSVFPVLAVLVFASGCVTPEVSMETPEGFAAYSHGDAVRVISPEGVVLRVRTVENTPPQNLAFWAEALERQMVDSGYLLIDRSDVTTLSGDAVLLEWLAPVSDDDWIYLTAISVVDSLIAVVEAAGPSSQYATYRQDIRRSLESLRVEAPES